MTKYVRGVSRPLPQSGDCVAATLYRLVCHIAIEIPQQLVNMIFSANSRRFIIISRIGHHSLHLLYDEYLIPFRSVEHYYGAQRCSGDLFEGVADSAVPECFLYSGSVFHIISQKSKLITQGALGKIERLFLERFCFFEGLDSLVGGQMKLHKALLLICAIGGAAGVEANPYQVELFADYEHIDSDQSSFGANAQMYFAPVRVDNHVLAEAAFLNRASNLTVRYGKATLFYDGEQLGEGGELVDFTNTRLDVDWYGVTTGVYLAFSQETYAPEDRYEDWPDYGDWGAKVGFMPMPGILVYTDYQDEVGYKPNFSVKYVSNMTNGKAVNLEASYTDYGDDGRNFLQVGADIYLSRTFSVGGTISQQEDTRFGFRTQYFFSPTYYIGAFVSVDDDYEKLGVNAGMRF